MVLFKKTDYNTKITETEGKIPDISNLATKTALTTVENKIPVNRVVKRTNYNTKVAEIHTNLSSLDGKITKNKNDLDKTTNDTVLPFLINMLFNSEDVSQAYLIFQLIYRYFKTIINTN